MTCPDFTGTSPFHLALQESAITCLDISLQLLPKEILDIPHPQFLFPFLHAVQCGDREACQLLIRAGADVNQIDEESGRTALHFATELNDRDLVDFLISCEGLLDVVDVRGLTPLHIASIIEGKGALEAIVRRVGGGEVLDIRDSQGLTPLMHACLNGNTTSVKLLLKRKVKFYFINCHSSVFVHSFAVYLFIIHLFFCIIRLMCWLKILRGSTVCIMQLRVHHSLLMTLSSVLSRRTNNSLISK